jgi:exopolysaccharide biosynthesis polyprenyl glycosylphosphotransferase
VVAVVVTSVWLTPRLRQALVGALALAACVTMLRDRIATIDQTAAAMIAAGLMLLLPLAARPWLTRRWFQERALILGTGALARQIVEELDRRQHGPDLLVGIADDGGVVDPPMRKLLVGPLANLGTLIDDLRPDRIVVALADRRGRLPVGELLEARVRGVAVDDAVDLYERLTGKLAIESLTPSNLIASKDFRKSRFDLVWTHALSVVASAVALVALAPLFALIALAIKIDSAGPVFFVHARVGMGGRRFNLIKFRTMLPSQAVTSEWVGDNGNRITRVGRWLRKFRLDELPQLFNVIRGDMNLVGPRPHPVSNFELFRQNIPYYSLRATIRPGVTGWAQVRQGYANNLEEEVEKMRYDLYYIKHMSVWLDLRILVQTVRTVLAGRETVAPQRSTGASPAPGGDLRWIAPPSDRIAAGVRYRSFDPLTLVRPGSTVRSKETRMTSGHASSVGALILLALVSASAAGGPLQALQVMGSGHATINCAPRLGPSCTVRTTDGASIATADGVVLLDGSFDIRFDTGTTGTLNGWPAGVQQGLEQGMCFAGSHLGFLTGANGDVLRFVNVGTVCEESSPGSPLQINGTFRITGGDGQFAAAAGVGTMAMSVTRDTGTVFLKMSGTLTY